MRQFLMPYATWPAVFLSLLTACIGTEYVDVPLGTDRSALTLTPRSLSLVVGTEATVSAQYVNFEGEAEVVPLVWESGDAAVATVSPTGEVAGLAPGQTHVFAQAPGGQRDSALVTVVVDVQAVATVEISGSVDTLGLGASRMLTATVRNQPGDILTGVMVSWESSDPGIVAVDEMGVIRGVAPGRATITATAEGVGSLPWPVQVGSGIRRGPFSGRSGYTVTGTATLAMEGGAYVLRFSDDFMAQPGPGLYVYLAPQANSSAGGAQLAALTANSGAQAYPIPSSVDPAAHTHVLIYCQPFGVVFGAAPLE